MKGRHGAPFLFCSLSSLLYSAMTRRVSRPLGKSMVTAYLPGGKLPIAALRPVLRPASMDRPSTSSTQKLNSLGPSMVRVSVNGFGQALATCAAGSDSRPVVKGPITLQVVS